ASGIVGYAYATRWRTRPAYRFSTEITVYLDPECRRLGIGSRLYEELLAKLQARGVHAAMAGIALPNEASVALHEKFGFSKVAHFKEVGFKFNTWIDVGYWQHNF
ncbi:MAG TPA: GNAT family N-acetyltransferase, partial [Polyangiaceae bacterium]|nr:GNAT family N-acetyltransferase [Polyangiaceae bacterium]